MKTRFGISIVVVLLLMAWVTPQEPVDYSFKPESRMWIDGTSSLHDWTSEVSKVTGNMRTSGDSPATVTNVEVIVPVRSIKGKNGTMDKKTYEALKADKHPTIRYELDRVSAATPGDAGRFSLQTTGKLTVAGVTKPIAMTVEAQPLPDGRIRFTGSHTMQMSDFGIEPPTAMLGTLKTGDRISVRIDVVAAEQPDATH